MNNRAPVGKIKFRAWVNTDPPCFIDVIDIDEFGAKQQIKEYFLANKLPEPSVIRLKKLTGKKHCSVQ